MDDATLRGDCTRCIGLCCVALAFDRGGHFAFDKPAGLACPLLTPDHRCGIHDRLEVSGLSGCARYDCRGAGQIVTALFAGLSWRDSPSIARQMFAAFAKLREIQLLRALAKEHPTFRVRLDPPAGWTLEALLLLDLGKVKQEFRSLASPAGPPMLPAG